jgi:hypothetical protein
MGLKTTVYSGPQLLLKVFYPNDGKEKTIGFASNLAYTVTQGQKPIFTVDSTFPSEIAQSASPSMVHGSLSIFLPKGTTPESAGLIPYRTDAQGQNNMAASKYLNIRIYDRLTSAMIFSLDFCKFGQYTMNIGARQIVRVDMVFEGYFVTPGTTF